MNKQSGQIFAFLGGALLGAAVTYLLTTDEGDDIVSDFKDMAQKMKRDVEDALRKAGGGRATATTEEEDMMGV